MSDTPYTPSAEALETLEALKRAVAKELERKRRLGQYSVFWIDGKIVYQGKDAPVEGDNDTSPDSPRITR